MGWPHSFIIWTILGYLKGYSNREQEDHHRQENPERVGHILDDSGWRRCLCQKLISKYSNELRLVTLCFSHRSCYWIAIVLPLKEIGEDGTVTYWKGFVFPISASIISTWVWLVNNFISGVNLASLKASLHSMKVDSAALSSIWILVRCFIAWPKTWNGKKCFTTPSIPAPRSD